jgi:predicted outer membrane repeat protein
VSRLGAATLAVALLGPASVARADGRVTLCGTDVAAGPAGQLNLAQAIARGGRITFDCGAGAVIRVTQSHTVAVPVEIDGGGQVILDAQDATSMFVAIGSASPVVFRNITLRDGPNNFGAAGAAASFGGIFTGPVTLELRNVTVEATRSPITADTVNVYAGRFAGNEGPVLRARNIRLSGETVFEDNDGPPFAPLVDAAGSFGTGSATVEDSVFHSNGPIVWNGSLTVRRSSFLSNGRGATNGGAVSVTGQASIEKTEFTNNTASNGGAIWLSGSLLELRRSQFRGNRAQRRGGAIALSITAASRVSVAYTTFTANTAENGGAISLADMPTFGGRIEGHVVTFVRNVATNSGGAIYAGEGAVHLSRVLFLENGAGTAGAVYGGIMSGLPLRMGNALVVRTAAGDALRGSNIELVNSTIADNAAIGITLLPQSPLDLPGTVPTLKLTNTIVLNNAGGNCSPILSPGTLVDGGSNLQFPGRDCGDAIRTADPVLDAFYVPVVDSPARFAGNNQVCVEDPLVRARDIFGESRPEGPRCTIGAIERDLHRLAMLSLRRQREGPGQDVARRMFDRLGLDRGP